MSDDPQLPQDSTSVQPGDQSTSANPQGGGLTIPDDVLAKFGPLIELIKASESMNDEERQYWINILPIMTEDQVKSLEEILTSEKAQLAAIDAKYNKQIESMGQQKAVEDIDAHRRAKREQRTQTEQEDLTKQKNEEEDILKKIEEA